MRLRDFEQCLTARLFKKKADLGYTSVHSSLDRQSCKVFFFSTHPFQEGKDLEISHDMSSNFEVRKGQRTTPNVATNKVQQVTSVLFPHRCNTDIVTLSLIRYLIVIVIVIVIDPLSEVYFHRCNKDRVALSSVFSTGTVLVRFC